MSSSDRSEEYSGIIAFANTEKGFQGILKQRYTDFIVREIDPAGAIAQLTNLSGKELENRMFPPRDKPDLAPEALEEFIVSLRALIPVDDEKAAALKQFLAQAAARNSECPDAYIVCGSTDKPTRSGVHQLFKLKFKGVVESDTTQVDGVSSIRIQPAFKLKRGWNNRASEAWPATVPNFLRFVVAKENCDTSAAISCLSKYFRCGGDSIRYAGTKDKRGVTFQFMTMYRRKPSDIAVLNRFQFPPTIRVGNFEYVNDQLGLGDLSGNRFEITLRDVSASVSDLESMCVALKHSGFVNYFGLQRFGVGGTPNQDIGLAVFQGRWKQAVDLIFADRAGDRSDIIEMKAKYFEGNFKEAARACPRFMNVERCILEHLSKHDNDPAGAIGTVPKASSLMWAHAYQSHVWNKAVSFRIQQLGMQVVEGDLVGEAPSRDEGEDDEPSRMTGDGFTRVGTMEASSVQVVTAEDVATNRYSLEDVILPLPGSAVQLPNNAVRQYYEDLLSADGISLTYFKDKAPPQYRMKGTYRRIIQSAHDLTWKIVEYSEANAEISTTELRSFDQPAGSKKRDREVADGAAEGEQEIESNEAATKKMRVDAASSSDAQVESAASAAVDVPANCGTGRVALAINFSLPPGTYATMLLRELTKQSMETQFHSNMTAEHADNNAVPASTSISNASA